MKDKLLHGVLIISLLALAGVVIYGGYSYYDLSIKAQNNRSQLTNELAETRQRFAQREEELQSQINDLKSEVEDLQEDKRTLVEAYQNEQEQTSEFRGRIDQMSGEIERYEKLQQIDEEILKKYSKTYFLNENYTPSSLAKINPKYLYDEDEPEQIHGEVYPFLKGLMDAARKNDIDIHIVSAYRSFDEQTELRAKYDIIYGGGTANTFSASQGYSEHQLGTTVDFTTMNIGRVLDGFENTESYEWLLQNAYKYGFILSYPKDNDYYVFEPWHWRFVGRELAGDLHDENMSFYDMDQREIDKYRLSVFD